MSDPLSAAASAAGIVSLGLQVCQGIVQYYSSWKDFTVDVTSTYELVEQLRGIFDLLNTTLKSSPLEDASAAEHVRSSIRKCEGGILRLHKRLEKIKAKDLEEGTKYPNPKQKLISQGKRLVYPFQQGTLGKLRDAVSELRDNLTPALDALNLDIGGTVLKELRGFRAEQQKWHLEEKNKKVLAWLSPLDFVERQCAFLSTRHSSSGSWFLNNDDFKSWQNGIIGTRPGLWCHGGMGSGKSVMMSAVVNHLQRFFVPDELALAYVYCDWQDSKAQTPTNLMGSLLKQLVEGKDSMPQHVLDCYAEHKNGKAPLSVDECVWLARRLAPQFRRVIFLIDALDELAYCPKESDSSRMLIMEGALNNLLETNEQSINRFQVFTTSRFHQQLATEYFASIKVSVPKEDLLDYFRYELKSNASISPWINPELAKKVINDPSLFNSITERCMAQAGDMFLLARLHLDHIKRQINMRQLQRALNELPNKLADSISGAIHRLKSQSPMLRDIGNSVLLWVTHSLRPLRITELQHALAVEPGDATFLDDGITPQSILISSCVGLVILENESGIIRLINYSIKEYLDENPLEWHLNPNLTITNTCVTYLLLNDFDIQTNIEEPLMNDFFTQSPFLVYAAEHWGSHACLNKESGLENLVLTLLLDDKKACFSFRALFMAVWGDLKCCPSLANGLHLAAFFGLDIYIRALIAQGKPVDSADSLDRTALYIAASTGRHKAAELLLSAGADVTGRVKRGRQKSQKVKMWYYPPWARDDTRGEAVEAAAETGHEEIVRLLLRNKANLSRFGIHNGPLEAAVFGGYRNIVKILLHEGAVVEKTTIQASVYIGDIEILRSLIDQLPEPESKPRKPWNYPYNYEPATTKNLADALYAAALANRLSCAKVLLEYHVDADAEINGFYRTPLQAAASYGHIDMIELLLRYGANINSVSNEWINAHDKAAHYFLFNPSLDEETLNAGLEQLARCNHSQFRPPPEEVFFQKPDLEGYSISEDEVSAYRAFTVATEVSPKEHKPLSSASSVSPELKEQNTSSVFQTPAPSHPEYRSSFWKDILQDQVDSSRISGRHGSALQAACHAGLYEVVMLLLDSGANVNVYAGYFGTAIQAAAALGKHDIVELLLQRGALVNTLSGHFGNPLHAAASGGHKDVVSSLLTAGARVNARGGEYGFPLQAAARSAEIDIVRILLEAGAAINAKGGHYGYALQAATMGVPASALKTAVADFEISHIAKRRYELGDYFQLVRNSYARWQMRVRGVFGKMLQNAAGGAFGNAQEVFMNDEERTRLLFLNASSEFKSNLDVVKYLLDAGAEPNAHGGIFYSAMHAAAYAGRIDVVRLLLENGADMNAEAEDLGKFKLSLGDTNPASSKNASPLENAVLMGHSSLVKFLLDNGANPNFKSGYRGMTPLHFAAATRNEEAIRLLLEAGVDVNSGDSDDENGSRTPLDEAMEPALSFKTYTSIFWRQEKSALGAVTLLVDNGANASSRNRALRRAVTNLYNTPANQDIIRTLIESGVDVSAGQDYDPKAKFFSSYPSWDKKPLLLLIDQGSEDIEVYNMILQAGVSVETEGKNILWFAIRRNIKEVVTLLLDHGFRVDDEIFEEAVCKLDDQEGHNIRNGHNMWLDGEEISPSIERWLKNKKEILSLLQASRS